MDFITGPSENVKYIRSHNIIFAVVDKISKMCHYIPSCSDMTVEELAKVIT